MFQDAAPGETSFIHSALALTLDLQGCRGITQRGTRENDKVQHTLRKWLSPATRVSGQKEVSQLNG